MSVSKGLRFRVLERDRFTCRYCGRSAPDVTLHADHIHPRSRGGPDRIENLITACSDCNGGKAARLLDPDVAAVIGTPFAPIETFPHPDMCSTCRTGGLGDMRMYGALREEAEGGHGYRALYRCDRGHVWTTWWADTHRLTGQELFELHADDMMSRWPTGAAT